MGLRVSTVPDQKTKWLIEWEAEEEESDRPSFANWMIEKADALEAEVAEYDQSFKLYDNAMRRGTKLWQEAHPERYGIWPDGADLIAWLMERLDAGLGREYAEASGRTAAQGDLDFFTGQLKKARNIIWQLIYPYISEDNIAYTEENMEALCENALPEIWDTLLEVGPEHDADRDTT